MRFCISMTLTFTYQPFYTERPWLVYFRLLRHNLSGVPFVVNIFISPSEILLFWQLSIPFFILKFKHLRTTLKQVEQIWFNTKDESHTVFCIKVYSKPPTITLTSVQKMWSLKSRLSGINDWVEHPHPSSVRSLTKGKRT